jgi:hypothetical protein
MLTVCRCSRDVKLTGKTFLRTEYIGCTLLECFCCNQCSGTISFITGSDTIELTGSPDDVKIVCKGNECEKRDSTMTCGPLRFNKRYEIFGKFEYIQKGYKNKWFVVKSFKLLE